ncbi:HIT family protein [Alcaligenes faecalis]|uniref:HIT family protein n=1 Tax=Alcaligenes faecalis TaxID=511 RepID=UPI00137BACA7|nr:HIT family protein [Alcaligenes faecalis]QHS37169.1 HIT family protein [Alcaligenes faecalis]
MVNPEYGRTPELIDFQSKFRLDELEIATVPGWRLSLRPKQLTLGSMVLSVVSGACNHADLTPDEGAGLVDGFALSELLAREVFGAVRINVLCLMMQDPIVHFHILPRYDRPHTYAGRTWIDADWPGPPVVGAGEDDPSVLQVLGHDLRSAVLRLRG